MEENSVPSEDFSLPVLPYQTPIFDDHFLLGDKIGEGSYGTTYVCTQKSTGKHFHSKSIPKRRLLCEEDYEEVRMEIKVMHLLSEHPNVAQIQGTYEDPVSVHVVMERCGGGDLCDRILQKGKHSEKEAVKLITTIVGLVEDCHSLGIMHRDLKPDIFLFENQHEDANMKVTDFMFSAFFKPG